MTDRLKAFNFFFFWVAEKYFLLFLFIFIIFSFFVYFLCVCFESFFRIFFSRLRESGEHSNLCSMRISNIWNDPIVKVYYQNVNLLIS